MGFASKLSMNVFSKDSADDDTVLASPDTQFGAGVLPQPSAGDGGQRRTASHDAGIDHLHHKRHCPRAGAARRVVLLLDHGGRRHDERVPGRAGEEG